jgi:outer membrane protein, adhesin transport system
MPFKFFFGAVLDDHVPTLFIAKASSLTPFATVPFKRKRHGSERSLSLISRPGLWACLVGLWLGTAALASYAQTNPLNLPYLLEQASLYHPSMQAARLDARASTEDLLAVQRQRWPTVSAVLEQGISATTSTAAPASRILRLEQTLWDSGRTSARIAEAEVFTSIGETRISLQAQTLALQAVNAWQNLLASRDRVAFAQATILKLSAYRDQIQRRIANEVSPAIDLELVQSRMLQTQVELTQAKTTLKAALTRLEQVSGVNDLARHLENLPAMSGLEATREVPALFSDTDWALAARAHPTVAKTRFEQKAAEQRILAKQAEQWPQIYARLDQPVANTNSTNKTSSFVGLRYTPGAGLSSLAEAKALSSRAASLEQGTEAAVREVFETMQTDREEFLNNRERIQALSTAVEGSGKVLDSYGRQFTAGRKTWQDLMNAVREVAQNQYALADANAAMLGALYRLQIRLGQDILSVAMVNPKP